MVLNLYYLGMVIVYVGLLKRSRHNLMIPYGMGLQNHVNLGVDGSRGVRNRVYLIVNGRGDHVNVSVSVSVLGYHVVKQVVHVIVRVLLKDVYLILHERVHMDVVGYHVVKDVYLILRERILLDVVGDHVHVVHVVKNHVYVILLYLLLVL